MIAALFVQTNGVYFGLPDVDPWDQARDARLYAGPWPVVAHPPCERWGRLEAVERWGGVLEHPEASTAWEAFDIPKPPREGGWIFASGIRGWTLRPAWTCCVEQGTYGHRARKATWLYAVAPTLPSLRWGRSSGDRMDEGFHSAEERRAARAAGVKPRPRLSTAENIATPIIFRDLLLGIARSVQAREAR